MNTVVLVSQVSHIRFWAGISTNTEVDLHLEMKGNKSGSLDKIEDGIKLKSCIQSS